MNLKKFEPYLDDKHTFPEYILVNCQKYCSKLIAVKHDRKQKFHLHKEKTETFIVIEGDVTIETMAGLDITKFQMSPAEQLTIYPGDLHRFKLRGRGGIVLEVSTYHKDSDTYRLEGEDE